MSDLLIILPRTPKLIGIAADHGGFGISIDKVTQQLEDEGVTKFNQPFDKLMETLAQNHVRSTR